MDSIVCTYGTDLMQRRSRLRAIAQHSDSPRMSTIEFYSRATRRWVLEGTRWKYPPTYIDLLNRYTAGFIR